jgi:hypothetical protein
MAADSPRLRLGFSQLSEHKSISELHSIIAPHLLSPSPAQAEEIRGVPSRRHIAAPGDGITRRIRPPAPRARMARGGQWLRANCVQFGVESGYRPRVEDGAGAILPRPEKVTGTERPA